MKKFCLIVLSVCIVASIVSAQTKEVVAIRKYTRDNMASMVGEFISFLSIPNVASDSVNIPGNTGFIMQMMKKRGIENIRLLYAVSKATPPAIYGEVNVPGAKRTIFFYAHYDGQPVNPDQWAKGLSPFEPKLFSESIERNGKNIPFPKDSVFNPEWRIYCRSSSDDKAGVVAILNAFEAVRQSGIQSTSNLKFFFEGEEEAGSPHLQEIMQQHGSLLQSDLWIICDGPVHQSGKKQIVFGVRGDAHLELTVYASKRPLHSGHYGNWAPNPAMMLAKLLSSMKDDNGRVTIKGFYDDVTPLTATEKNALDKVPVPDDQLKEELGIAATETPGLRLNEAINLPSLNINGMQSGNIGKMASNQIPTTASAVIDLRLVLGNDWERQQQKVIEHIKAQGYFVTDKEPTGDERKKHEKIIQVVAKKDGYNAQRTSMELPIIKNVIDAVGSTTQGQPVLVPTLGGSLPLYLFEKYLNAVTVTVPIANHDNNQHAENENIRLQNLFDGIETMAVLMMMK